MKIIMKTSTKEINEHKERSDRLKTKEQLEADVTNMFAAAIAFKAERYFKTDKARDMWIDKIAEVAKKWTRTVKEGEE